MIGEAELRRQAARWGVDPMVVDLDYSLGWFIAALYGATRRSDFEDDWNRRLSYLVRGGPAVEFEMAWKTTIEVLREIEECLAPSTSSGT
jgi:hypothetical protein